MRKIHISLAIGALAGVVDVIPMILQKLNGYACASAFVEWVVLGLIITHLEIGLKGWLKGLMTAEIVVLPVLILVAENGLGSIPIIAVMTAVLGSLVGWASGKFTGN